jgi:hypothetical protein
MKPPKHRLSFNKLSDTDFEQFAYDLLEELGFVNLDWRKGTGKKTSPADSGRDIVAHLHRTDVDRSRRTERWFGFPYWETFPQSPLSKVWGNQLPAGPYNRPGLRPIQRP